MGLAMLLMCLEDVVQWSVEQAEALGKREEEGGIGAELTLLRRAND